MGYIIAGLAIAAVGAGTSAAGTAQNASAVRDAAKFNAYLENKFGKKWTANADQLIEEKQDKLYNIGDIFERFQGGGAFGDTNTLANLRKYQEDFSDLAAGDFSAFEGQLRSAMLDNLATSVGTGSPVGSYAELSANTLLNLRRAGAAEAASTTGFLSGLHNELLGMEFGVMDQGFNLKYQIDRNRLSAITGYQAQAAQTAGVGTQAAGTALQQVGSSLVSYGMFNQQQANQQQQTNLGGHTASGQAFYGGTPYSASPYVAPASYAVAPIGYNPPALPSVNRAWGDGSGGSVLPPPPPDVGYWNVGLGSTVPANYDLYGQPRTTIGLANGPFNAFANTSTVGYDIITATR